MACVARPLIAAPRVACARFCTAPQGWQSQGSQEPLGVNQASARPVNPHYVVRYTDMRANLENMPDREGFKRYTRKSEEHISHASPRMTSESASVVHEMGVLAKRGRWQEALKLFDNVTEPEVGVRVAAMNAWAKGMQVQQVYRAFRGFDEKYNVVYATLLGCLGRAQLIEEVEQLWQEMANIGMTPDQVAYTMMITAQGFAHNSERALFFLNEMESKGMTIGETEFGCALGACGKSGDSVRAWELYKRMQDKNVRPHIGHLTSLVTSHARTKDEEGGRKGFAEFKSLGLAPDLIAYTALCQCFPVDGSVAKIEAVLADLRQAGIQPNAVFWIVVLRAADDEGLDEKFDEVVEQMKTAGIPKTRDVDAVIRKRQQRVSAAAAAPALPAGWREASDPTSGNSYYWNESDPAGTTTWERPI